MRSFARAFMRLCVCVCFKDLRFLSCFSIHVNLRMIEYPLAWFKSEQLTQSFSVTFSEITLYTP